MNLSRGLATSLTVFTLTCVAAAGGDRWWELYTPEEQKKLLVEYEKHLLPNNNGYHGEKFFKAANMYRHVKVQPPLVAGAIAWSDLYNKEGDNKKKLSQAMCRLRLLEDIWRTAPMAGADRGAWRNVQKLPDRMIDEFFWAMKYDNDKSTWLLMIGSFGPRASKIHAELRDYVIEKKLVDGKPVLDRIKKQ